MSENPSFKGVYPILPTPFHEDEAIDLESFERMVAFAVEVGVDGVTILGVLGETNRMVDAEREALIQVAVRASDGRIPVVVGTSHTGTRAAAELSRVAEEMGARGVMVTPQREATPNPQRVFEHYSAIAERCSLPIVLQDHPVSTQVHMGLDLVLRVVREVESIACIKQEAPPSPARVSALIDGMAERRVPILTGLGALYGGFELQRGADGFMTGFAFPEVLMAMVAAAKDGDEGRLMAIYSRFLPLIVFEQQPGVAIRKEIFRMRGLMPSGRVRHPGGNIDERTRDQLHGVLRYVLPDVDLTKPLRIGEIGE